LAILVIWCSRTAVAGGH